MHLFNDRLPLVSGTSVTNKTQIYRSEILEQIRLCKEPAKSKDILIVVHDQLQYLEKCLESIFLNTENYRLYIYDNASSAPTRLYLESLKHANLIHELIRSETNDGFIRPNNILAKKTESDYLILLNSDTEVLAGWDLALVNALKFYNVDLVGYSGSKVDENGYGNLQAFGFDIDYVCGWCMCLSRKVYEEIGLFDESNIRFAYGEDSDLSFRVREANRKIFSLHLDLVYHHGNKTIEQVHREMGDEVKKSFAENHDYIRRRWRKYLKK